MSHQVIPISGETNPPHEQVATAERLMAAGKWEQARGLFQQAIRFDRTCRSRNAFGCFLWKTAQYAAAANQFSQVLFEATEQQDSAHLAAAASNLAAVYREQREPEHAVRFQRFALDVEVQRANLKANGQTVDSAFGNVAVDLILAGDYDRAKQLIWQSLLHETAAGSIEGEAADWGNLGIIAGLQGQIRTGLTYLWRALTLHRKLGDTRGIGCDYLHLGQLIARLNRRKLAARCLLHAIRHFRQARLHELAEKAGQALADQLAEAEARRYFANLDCRRN